VAVDLFLTAEEPRTKSVDGKRPEVSPNYHYIRSIILKRFAASYPATTVNGLSKQHLDGFMASLNKVGPKSKNHRPVASAKSRNHYRAAIRQFLDWAVRNDYLPRNHRLSEADRSG
jgi:hypothetical protein